MRYLILLCLQILQLNLSLGIPFKPDKNGHERHPKEIVNNPGVGFNYVGKDALFLDPQLVNTRKYNSKDNVNDEKIVHADQEVINAKVSDFSTSGSKNAILSIPIFHDLESLLESLNGKDDLSVSEFASKNIEKDGFSRIVRSDGSDSESHKSVQNEDILIALSNDCDEDCERVIFGTSDASNFINEQIAPFSSNRNTAFLGTQSQGLTPLGLPPILKPNSQLNSNLKHITGTGIQGGEVENLSPILPSRSLLNPSLEVHNDSSNQGRALGSLSTILSPNAVPNQNSGQISGTIDQRVAIERLLAILSPDLLPNLVIPTDTRKQAKILASLLTFLPPDALPNSNLQIPADAGTLGRTLESLTRMLPTTVLSNSNFVSNTVASKQEGALQNLSTLSSDAPQNVGLRLPFDSGNQRGVSDRFSTILQPTVLPDPNLKFNSANINQRDSHERFSTSVPPGAPQHSNLKLSNKLVNQGGAVGSLPTIVAPSRLHNLSSGHSTSFNNQGGAIESLSTSLAPGALPNQNLKLSTGISNQRGTFGSLSTSLAPGAQPNPNLKLSTGINNQRGTFGSFSTSLAPGAQPNPNLRLSTGITNQRGTFGSLSTSLEPGAQPNPNLRLSTDISNQRGALGSLSTIASTGNLQNPNLNLSTGINNERGALGISPAISSPGNLPNPVHQTTTVKQGETLASLLTILSPEALPKAQQNTNLQLSTTNSKQIGIQRSLSTQLSSNVVPRQNLRLPSVANKQGKTLESLSTILPPGAPPKPNLRVLNNVNTNGVPVNNVGLTPGSSAGGINIQPPFPSVQEMLAAQELVAMFRTVTSQTNEGIISPNPILSNTPSTVPSTPMIQIPVMCNTAMCSALVPFNNALPGGALGKSINDGGAVGSPTNVNTISAAEQAVHYLIAVTCNDGVCTANRISSSRATPA